jgi:hypothetical protein
LLASTTSSRRPRIAVPTISSDSPAEYTSAVSIRLIPASRARWMIRIEASWSGLPIAPNIIAPSEMSLTETPVPPRVLRCMSCGALLNRFCWSFDHSTAGPRSVSLIVAPACAILPTCWAARGPLGEWTCWTNSGP